MVRSGMVDPWSEAACMAQRPRVPAPAQPRGLLPLPAGTAGDLRFACRRPPLRRCAAPAQGGALSAGPAHILDRLPAAGPLVLRPDCLGSADACHLLPH